MDIRESLRYTQYGESVQAMEKTTGVNRKTVARYREWTTERGLLEGSLPPLRVASIAQRDDECDTATNPDAQSPAGPGAEHLQLPSPETQRADLWANQRGKNPLGASACPRGVQARSGCPVHQRSDRPE